MYKEQTLYDRYIKVSLYNTSGTLTKYINKDKRIITLNIQSRKQGNKVSGPLGRSSGYSTMKLIEGYNHTHAQIEDSTVNVRTYTAIGPLYKLKKLADLERGLHPDGSPFVSGDRIYVREDHSKWHVFTSFSDTKEDTSFYKITQYRSTIPSIDIDTPDTGMKPNITFSTNIVQGQVCYKTVVKIKNLNLGTINIRDWDKMIITAGYKTGDMVKYSCPIFSSYIESPNPDGVTVFEGITVGQADDVLYDGRIRINFNSEKVTLRELVESCARDMGLDSTITIPDKRNDILLMGIEMSVSKQTVYAQNGLAVISWLQNTITQVLYDQCLMSAVVQLIDGTILVMGIDGPNSANAHTENIINLDMVSGATFNGSALTVEAPWNPNLKPGGLFYLPPMFINGSRLPNAVDPTLYMNDDNLYRTLTMSVAFSTVENINKMTVLAVPAQYAKEIPEHITSQAQPEAQADWMNKVFMQDKKAEHKIDIGVELTSSQTSAIDSGVSNTKINTFDQGRSPVIALGGSALKISSVEVGNCLSTIAQYWGKALKLEGKGNGRNAYFHLTKDQAKQKGQRALASQNDSIPFYIMWWPLIAIATYWKKQEDDSIGAANNWDDIDLKNPDKIHEGRSLFIPTFTSYSALVTLKDTYKNIYNDYKNTYPSWSTWWKEAYYYLGGTDELE